MLHSFCTLPLWFPPLFLLYSTRYWKCKFDSLSIGFVWTIFFHVIWVFLDTPSTCQTSFAALLLVSIPVRFKAPQGYGIYCSTLFWQYTIFTSFGYCWLIRCQNVWVYFYFFTTSSNSYPFVVDDLWFPKAVLISSSVTKDNFLFLITPFEVLTLSCI